MTITKAARRIRNVSIDIPSGSTPYLRVEKVCEVIEDGIIFAENKCSESVGKFTEEEQVIYDDFIAMLLAKE